MKPIIREILVVAAGVLIAAAFYGIIRTVDPALDWPTALVGALILAGGIYALGSEGA